MAISGLKLGQVTKVVEILKRLKKHKKRTVPLLLTENIQNILTLET